MRVIASIDPNNKIFKTTIDADSVSKDKCINNDDGFYNTNYVLSAKAKKARKKGKVAFT